MKKVRTCYISPEERYLIAQVAGGNFSAGIEICAKNFAAFAKGSKNYNKSISRIHRGFQLKNELPISNLISECLADGHSLQGFLMAIACLLSEGEIAIDINSNVIKSDNWIG